MSTHCVICHASLPANKNPTPDPVFGVLECPECHSLILKVFVTLSLETLQDFNVGVKFTPPRLALMQELCRKGMFGSGLCAVSMLGVMTRSEDAESGDVTFTQTLPLYMISDTGDSGDAGC